MNEYLIDTEARKKLAEELRHFVAGSTTNRQFEARASRSADAAVRQLETEAWGLYDDLSEHKLTGPHALTPEDRRYFARAILFLKTRQPWPQPGFGIGFLLLLSIFGSFLWSITAFSLAAWASFGASVVITAASVRWRRKHTDMAIWPFGSREAYDAALAEPPYLAGRPPAN